MSVSYVWDVRAYLLHLIISMIFGDKSLTHVHVAYLLYRNNLDICHKYARGVIALVYLYDHLSYASQYNIKQVGSYMTLPMVSKLL